MKQIPAVFHYFVQSAEEEKLILVEQIKKRYSIFFLFFPKQLNF